MIPRPPAVTLFPYTTLFRSSANYNGPDSFTFKAGDGALDSNIAAVTISVTAVNDAPVANAQSVTDRKSTRLNSSHLGTSYAVFCFKKKKLSPMSWSLLWAAP